jgi:hypothetical protein
VERIPAVFLQHWIQLSNDSDWSVESSPYSRFFMFRQLKQCDVVNHIWQCQFGRQAGHLRVSNWYRYFLRQ